MGTTMTPVAFFSEDITLIPHTATKAGHIDRPVSIKEFAAGRPVSLYTVEETGDYLVRTIGNEFMEGPERRKPKTESVSIKPNWKFAAGVYIEVLKDPDADERARLDAEHEIMRMAGYADNYHALVKRKLTGTSVKIGSPSKEEPSA